MRWQRLLVLVVLALPGNGLPALTPPDPAQQAARFWRERHKNDNARRAVAAYRTLLHALPRDHAVRVAFIRAAQYYGEFFLTGEQPRLALYTEAIAAGEQAVALRPREAAAHFWLGTAYGLYADVKGGVRAISYVNKFKAALEQAVRLDPLYENGAPLNTLGMMYFKAPGWPFSFGDDKKALELLRRSHRLSRPNLVVNRLLAEVVLEEVGKPEALKLVEAALAMPDRPGYVLEDRKIRRELLELRKKILD